MSMLMIDPEKDLCICVFFIPAMYDHRDLKFLKGKVLVSAADAVGKNDGVVAVGASAAFITNSYSNGNELFLCEVIENNRKKNEDDPPWLITKVSPYVEENAQQVNIVTIKSLLEGAANQLSAANKLL